MSVSRTFGRLTAGLVAAATLLAPALPASAATGAAMRESSCAAQQNANMALDFTIDGSPADIWSSISGSPTGQLDTTKSGWGKCPGRIALFFTQQDPSVITGYYGAKFTLKQDLIVDSWGALNANGSVDQWYATNVKAGDKIPAGTEFNFILAYSKPSGADGSYIEVNAGDKHWTNDGLSWLSGASIKFKSVPAPTPTYQDNVHDFIRNYNSNDNQVVGTDSNQDNVVDTPPRPERDGYEFAGWYTERTGGTLVDDMQDATGLSATQKFYAHWEKSAPKQYTVQFNTMGGSFIEAQTVIQGATASKPAAPTRDGYSFAGWYADSYGTVMFDFTKPITENTIVYAKWVKTETGGGSTGGNGGNGGSTGGDGVNPAPGQYRVTFDSKGGTPVATQFVTSGEKATEPAAPTRQGYKFDAWYIDSTLERAYDWELPVTHEMNLYAGWILLGVTKYTVSFDTDGGTAIPSQQVEPGGLAAQPSDPVKDGYTFKGWDWNFAQPVNSDITVHASWVANPKGHTVTFATGEGSKIPSVTVTDGQPATRPDNDPTRDGYTFVGWYKDSTGLTPYDWSTPITKDTTIYAKWKKTGGDPTPVTHNVMFEENGGTSVADQKVANNALAYQPTDPTKDGYKFDGWYADKELKTKFDWKTPITKDTTLYAKWVKTDTPDPDPEPTPVTHTVKFETNEGGTVDDQKATDGEKAVKPTDPTRDGYTFNGWFSDKELTKEYDWNQPVTADLTLYAKWDPIPVEHKVTFESNGGSKIDPLTVTDGDKAQKPADPTLKDNKFDGWYTDKELTKPYEWNTPVTKDLTLYAKWEKTDTGGGEVDPKPTPTTHTVTFDSRGGSAVQPVKVEDGKPVAKPTDPLKAGYTFTGWKTDATLATDYDFTKPVTGDLTLYAGWKSDEQQPQPKTVKLSFDSNGGSAVETQQVKEGDKPSKPTDPTKAGYAFAGWYADKELTKEYDFAAPLNADATAYAKWEKNTTPQPATHTVSFDTAGGTPISPVKVTDGQTVKKPEQPTRDGYSFVNWIGPDGQPYDWTKPVTGDITITVRWQKNGGTDPDPDLKGDHKVSFDSAGGSEVSSQAVTDGSAAQKPADPTRDGYKFVTWTLNGAPYDFTQAVTKDLVLTARWEKIPAKTITIHFDGTDLPDQTLNDGDTLTQPATPTRDGYKFDGWYADKDYTDPYDFSKPVTGDLTLYAKWSQQATGTHLIHFNTNGGSQIPDQQVEDGKLPTQPQEPLKNGFKFAGWYGDEQLTKPFQFTQPLTGDVTLYAKWKLGHTVTFDSDGAGDITPEIVGDGDAIQLPNPPAKNGYEFEGWYTQDGTKVDSSTAITSDMKLTARWKPTNVATQTVENVKTAAQNVQKTAQKLAQTGAVGWVFAAAGIILLTFIGFAMVKRIRD